MAGPSQAATPITAGRRKETPCVAVGPDGGGHVLGHDGGQQQVGIAALSEPGGATVQPPGRSDLDGATTNAHGERPAPTGLRAGGGRDKLVVNGHCWNCGLRHTDREPSRDCANNGESFGPPPEIGFERDRGHRGRADDAQL